jgi:hypothetical protein
MTITQFIEKAIAGGWDKKRALYNPNDISSYVMEKMWLDPIAWQAVGRVEGWGTYDTDNKTTANNNIIGEISLLNMHLMIDSLWKGKSLEEFIATL